MSAISEKIRSYVNDPTCADHYGAWGALRPDQRLQIRKLCDTCDEFERIADTLMQERRDVAQEAIRAFAERLKEKMQDLARMEYGDEFYFLVGESFIDNTANEMTEGATE